MKWICLIEFNLKRKLSDLESWLTDSGRKSEIIRSKTQKVNLIYGRNLLIRQPKNQEDSITLVLTFHSALHTVFGVLKRAHWPTQKSPMLKQFYPNLQV